VLPGMRRKVFGALSRSGNNGGNKGN
jgi:hypothetical protein